jgi:cobalt-zinc-cadmium efflux system outer membrane protein
MTMKSYLIIQYVRCALGLALCGGWQAGGLAVAAPQDAEPRLELRSLVREAMANNPDIRAAQQRWEAAKAFVPQVKTLPDPMLNLGYENVDEREMMYGFSQEIPFPGKLRLRGAVATREAERVEQEYLAVPLRIIARLKEAFYDLAFVHRSIETVEKNRRVLLDFAQTAEARYAVGRGVQQDIFRAQTEVSRLLGRLATLEQRKASLQAEINRLVNRPPAAPLGIPQPLQVQPLRHSLEEFTVLIEQASPVLQAQNKSVERSEQSIALARRELLPDFAVSASGIRNETARKNGYQVMLGIKVPLYYATKQREAVREALASREAAVQEAHAVRQELLFHVRDNVVQVQRAEKLIALFTDAILPQARLTLESAQAGYAVGKVDFLTLLSSLLTLQDNELELHGEITEHAKALARLEEVIGGVP